MVVSVYNDMSAPGMKSFTADKKIANNEDFDSLTAVHSILFEKMKRPNDSETKLPETEETEPETEAVPSPAPKPNNGGNGNNNGGGSGNSNNNESDMPADSEPEKKPAKPEKDKTNDTTAAQDKTKEEALLNDRVNAIKNAALSSRSDTATGTVASVSLSNNRADSAEKEKNTADWRVVMNDEWKIRAIDVGLVSDIVPVRTMPIKESIVRNIISEHILDI